MKKLLLLFCLAIAVLAASGQSPIPNGNFESWNSSLLENPAYFPNTSNWDEFFRYHLPLNVIKSTEAYQGTYALELTTNASATDTVFGYIVNANPNEAPEDWKGGIPYDQQATGLHGWYKYNVEAADSATLIVAFSKGGVNIGTYYVKLGGIKDSYTPFGAVFSPALTEAPDSVVFGAVSCKFSKGMDQPHGPAGSTLFLDSISFTGVASQPSMLNGNFETWDRYVFDVPDQWNIQTERGAGYVKSTDAAEGNFALELTTYNSNQSGHTIARAVNASTGYYPQNCNGDCHLMGGYPFTNQADTLVLSYKYSPAVPSDTAWINMSLKKDGSILWSQIMFLPEVENYTEMEMPFSVPEIPDSVVVEVQSGLWQDTALIYAGAHLWVDGIHFRSEEQVPTGLPGTRQKDNWRIYPNPSAGLVYLEGLSDNVRKIEITDVAGKKVYSYTGGLSPASAGIDLSTFGKGTYFISIDEGNGMRTQKVVVK